MKNIFYKPGDGWVGDTMTVSFIFSTFMMREREIHRMSMDIVQAGIF